MEYVTEKDVMKQTTEIAQDVINTETRKYTKAVEKRNNRLKDQAKKTDILEKKSELEYSYNSARKDIADQNLDDDKEDKKQKDIQKYVDQEAKQLKKEAKAEEKNEEKKEAK